MLSNENYKLSDKEITEKGSKALIRELGYSGFLRYIRNFEEGHLYKETLINYWVCNCK